MYLVLYCFINRTRFKLRVVNSELMELFIVTCEKRNYWVSFENFSDNRSYYS